MTITPEQFNKITTKDEFNELKEAVLDMEKKFDNKLDTLLTVVDGLAKNLSDNQVERIANIAAHDRFEARIATVEKHLHL